MTEAVRRHIIAPMLALYPPPQHLRGDAVRRAEALAAYSKALSRFDVPTLVAGWEPITAEHRFWVWPNPGVVAEACARCAPPPPTVNDQEMRRQRAEEMADAYALRFMKTTHLAKVATAEGWAGRLRGYVHDAAWVQAQIICGVSPVAFPSGLVPPGHRPSSATEACAEYRESVGGAVERGRVRVSVPAELVREWKRACGQESLRR